MVSSDYFQLGGHNYVVMVFQSSNWISVYQVKIGMAKELVTKLRKYVGHFEVMDEFATDGASVYKSSEVQEFLTMF